ncbi:hypothetical protein AWB74_04549 [Caballeronia arvi]|uniref:Uncharacterized protein n=1 Tax=Caballeronia arvi TaxID=1777135 RepID=A0A158JYD6_9BURK|nr:hypothetical protein AWB74_04549 [Caballeronia arvi]
MHREEQHMFIGGEAQQLCAKQRPMFEIEGACGFELRETVHVGGLSIERDERHRDLQLRCDALHSLTVVLREGRAQALVTRYERVQSGLECGNVE